MFASLVGKDGADESGEGEGETDVVGGDGSGGELGVGSVEGEGESDVVGGDGSGGELGVGSVGEGVLGGASGEGLDGLLALSPIGELGSIPGLGRTGFKVRVDPTTSSAAPCGVGPRNSLSATPAATNMFSVVCPRRSTDSIRATSRGSS